MNLMEAILSGGGSPLSQISRQLGLSEEQVKQVTAQYIPALTNGIKKNVTQEGGLEGLMKALNKGRHDRYLDDAEALGSEQAVLDGNGILGHLLKSKDTSRQLAAKTAEKTGLDLGILKKALPLIAGVVMGALRKQGGNAGILTKKPQGGLSSVLGSLTSLLDADGEDSPIDDLLGLAKKFF